MTRWTAATILVVALAGCLGPDDQPLGGAPSRARPSLAQGFGALEGVVTDVTVSPIAGVAVVLLETNVSVTTSKAGTYSFDELRAGIYTVVARAAGFVPASEEVSVVSGRVSTLDVLLAPLVSDLPYTQAFENVGFFELGYVTGVNVTRFPLPPPLNISPSSLFITECQDGACGQSLELDPPVRTLLYELAWDAGTPLAERMNPFVSIPQTDFVWENIDLILFVEGTSPIYARADKEDFDALADRYREACESGDDTRCGYGFWDEGWPFETLVRPSGHCGSDVVGTCVVTQQEFTEVVSVFYNAPAPEGYAVLDDA